MNDEIRRKGRVESGIVITAGKAKKTITVEATRRVKHPQYRKFIKRRKRFLVHDERETASIGDFVSIIESRPLSKRKRWRLLEILEAGKMDFERVPGETAAEATPAEEVKTPAPEGSES